MIFISNLKRSFYHIFTFLVFITVLLCSAGCDLSENVSGSENLQPSEVSGEKVLKVNYIDVGQADSILIQSPNGANMLIDAGETKENAVLNYLNSLGIQKLDVVVATHPHEDHISEMSRVIDTFEIGEFYMPKKEHTTKSFEKMIDSLAAKNITPKEAKSGVDVNFDSDVECHIVAPCKNDYDNLNNWSAVIKITYGNNSFLFTGDAESLSENEIIESGADIKSDVLKVGHHGSRTSSSKSFLEKVSPEFAVISAGKENDYGHPNKETLDNLNSFGAEIFGTYDDGNIIAVSDGQNIEFSFEREVVHNEEFSQETENNEIFTESAVTADESAILQYIGNRKSKKFHRTTCPNLPSEQNRILFTSKSEAESQGYSPCGNCNP